MFWRISEWIQIIFDRLFDFTKNSAKQIKSVKNLKKKTVNINFLVARDLLKIFKDFLRLKWNISIFSINRTGFNEIG